MNATEHLVDASGLLLERGQQYDRPAGERSMQATTAAFEAVTGIHLTETQGWLFMALLKIVRSQTGAYKADSYLDLVAYTALMGEAASEAASEVPDCLNQARGGQ